MISPFRILEILIYSLVTFLPYVLVLIYPFRNRLRFGQTATAVFTSLAAIVQLGCDLIIAFGMVDITGPIRLAVLLIHVICFLILIRASLGKKLFVLLGTITFCLVINMASTLLTGLIFPTAAETRYQWSELVVTLVLQILLLVPYGIVTIKFIAPALHAPRKAPFGWLWLLNALVILAWLVMGLLDLPIAVIFFVTTVLAVTVTVISAFVANLANVARAPRQAAPKAPAQAPVRQPRPEKPAKAPKAAANAQPAPKRRERTVREPVAPVQEPVYQPAPQRDTAQKAAPVKAADADPQLPVLQRNNLMERIAESDQFHRELLRHVDAMAYRLERGQYDKLRLHVHSLQEQLSKESQAVYCDNKELNSVITYFIRMAGYCGAQVFTNMHVSATPDIATQDLTVILGSLLDYALDSCKELSSYDRRIYASLRNNGKAMYINVEFTCDAAVQATGLGMNICQEITQRYNGNLETSYINGIFKATAILHPEEEAAASADQYHVLLRENLLERVAESDQFHRELLRHVEAMSYRLNRQQYEKLQMHVHALQEQLSKEGQLSYCDNSELNSVITYFNRMAGYCGTRVFTNMHVANEADIPTKNLTVMLGNLLDEALASCKNQAGYDRRIYASVRNNGKSMYVNVEYTCDEAQQKPNLGMRVCNQIASLYNGHLETSNVNGIFKATAILRP